MTRALRTADRNAALFVRSTISDARYLEFMPGPATSASGRSGVFRAREARPGGVRVGVGPPPGR
jgi:hypothetical protein